MTSPVFALCDEYVATLARLDPVVAVRTGLAGEHGTATDFGPDGIAERADHDRGTLRRLAELAPTGDADRLAAAHMSERLTADLAGHDAGEWLRPVSAPFGELMSVRRYIDVTPRGTEDQWLRLIDRLAAVPEMLGGWRATLRLGVERGVVAARRQAVASAAQADDYVSTAVFSPLLDEYGDGRLRVRLEAAVAAAHAAYAETARYLRRDYAPHTVEADGVGPDRYRIAARQCLGADIDLREAYEWGWHELYRLEDEMAVEAAKILPGAPLDEVIEHLNDTEVLTDRVEYREWLQATHDTALAELNGVHFDIDSRLMTVEVVVVPDAGVGAASYSRPSEDLSRPGRTWWPVAGRERFAVWEELTTVFHEGVPGHHLQRGQVSVMGDRLSRFTKLRSVPGYGEGWALYAERLAGELGWHTIRGSRLGMLKNQARRAVRVAIDIGLHLNLPLPEAEARRHGPRWNFDVAVDVLRTRGRTSRHRLHSEVVRYCGWPAQATAYKLGERAWLASRAEAKAHKGADFDLKAWHTAALTLGPIGLGTLAETLRGIA